MIALYITLISIIIISIIVLWKIFIGYKSKEIYWEDGSTFYYRKSGWSNEYYLTIYIKRKLLGLTYLKKIARNSTYYWHHEINTLEKLKGELRVIIRKYIKDNKIDVNLKEWDGELFEPNLQRKRDRKLEKILNT